MCRELGLGWGTVSHHLAVLRKQDRINSYAVGKELRIFPNALSEREARWLSVLGDENGAGILGELRNRPGARLIDLSSSLGISRKVIRRHLAMLDDEGLVVRQGEARPRYHLQVDVAARELPDGLLPPTH